MFHENFAEVFVIAAESDTATGPLCRFSPIRSANKVAGDSTTLAGTAQTLKSAMDSPEIVGSTRICVFEGMDLWVLGLPAMSSHTCKKTNKTIQGVCCTQSIMIREGS